jgi:AraC-like DNA-binding protein
MKAFFRYLPQNESFINNGIQVTAGGSSQIPPNSAYPLSQHPANHTLNINKGRRLQEYQFIYISQGKGIFETELTKAYNISAGDLFVLFPGVLHYYEPSLETGWHEHWLELDGVLAETIINQYDFNPKEPVINIGHNETILDLFGKVIDEIRLEHIGYQYKLIGLAMNILGHVKANLLRKQTSNSHIDNIIRKACCLMMENIEHPYSIEEIAVKLKVGYHWFRSIFKEYTGSSPLNYLQQLRLAKGKELLKNSNMPVYLIAEAIGFETSKYFCHWFKKKVGKTPIVFRKSYRNL